MHISIYPHFLSIIAIAYTPYDGYVILYVKNICAHNAHCVRNDKKKRNLGLNTRGGQSRMNH